MNTKRSGTLIPAAGAVAAASVLSLFFPVSRVPAASRVEVPVARSAGAAGIGQLMPDTAFQDLSGQSRTLSGVTASSPWTVIAVTSPSCPLSRKFAPTLAALENAWRDRGVQFVFTGAIASDPPEELASLARTHGWKGILTAGGAHPLTAALRAESTTEVFVLDRSRTLHYRGAVDDQYGLGYQKEAATLTPLRDALETLTAGRRPVLEATTAPGCALEHAPEAGAGSASGPGVPPAAESAAVPTWHSTVSRIIQRHCQECHRPGGTGPFELMSMEDVASHAAMIRKVVTRGIMPPWFAAPQSGEHAITWSNDRSLPEASREALLAWLSGGRPEGNPADTPQPAVWPEEWAMGRPDTVLQFDDPVTVKATGRMSYQYREVKTDFREDRWIAGIEVQPTALAQVHHVLVFAKQPGQRQVTDGDNFLAAYVPGSSAVTYPAGYAKKLPAGAILVFQLHYTPNGTSVTDRTRLGLKFAPGPPEFEVQVAAAKQHQFRIPPGAPDHEVKGWLPVPFDARILSFMPHMHTRGKAFRYDLVDPAGERRELLNVPVYDFNWQLLYRAASPVMAKAGSRIESTAWFDNSAANPNNPDPAKTVTWGEQTEDEMMIGYLEYVREPVRPAAASAGNSSRAGNSTPAAGETLEGPLVLTPKALRLLGRRLDTDRDGRVSLAEAGGAFAALHRRLDTDRDGYVTAAEGRGAFEKRRG